MKTTLEPVGPMGIMLPPPPPPPAADAFAIYAYGDERLPPTMVPMLPPPTPREAPDTTGMSRAASLEAKRAWRLQQADPTVSGDASYRAMHPAAPSDVVAGNPSEYRSRSVRGAVPIHDPVSAADYNLSLKLAATAGTPRGQVTAAPWMGGERKAPSPQAPAMAPAPLGDASNAAPTPLTGLSHREKLEAMRALRQQNDEQTRQALASARR